MASNVLLFSARRGPSFILVASLVITVIIVFCNDMLLRDVSVLHVRLRVLAARELTSDKKGSALVTKLTKMQDENEKIEGVVKSKESEISDARSQLQDKMTDKHKTVVLVYTQFWKLNNWVKRIESRCCSGHFELTYEKKRFKESDIVVFHAFDMPTLDVLKSLLKSRPTSQRWVYAVWESPMYTPNPTPLNGLFNLTWTYRSDSDFWGPYGRYEQLSQEEIKRNEMAPVTDYTQGKSELVAWIVSNCVPQLRISFVHELKKYIKVDVFGGCSSKFGESRSCSKKKNEARDCIKKHKFYLSFENWLCEDYITEKYWSHLGDENVVPVVMGGANYTKLAIPGSYINVMDFKTVKQLAEYLQYLDKNNTAYNEYFRWRLKYNASGPFLITTCPICRGFDPENPPQPKVYHDLTDYWMKKGRCNQKDQLIKNMWNS